VICRLGTIKFRHQLAVATFLPAILCTFTDWSGATQTLGILFVLMLFLHGKQGFSVIRPFGSL
jgi:hypothetical protein